jgi:ATP-dependent DNA helicase RecG
MSVDLLKTPVEYLKSVGPIRADILKKELGIYTYQDLLYYFPYRYLDRTKEYTIREISSEQTFIQLKGLIVQKQILG